MITKDKFSGGGVLPVVNIEKDGVNIPCFIVFSSNRGVLSDAGGKVDPGEDIQKTCTREFYEESCKLFSIDDQLIINHKYIDINCGPTYYRTYFPLIDFGVDKSDFSNNRSILKLRRTYKYFLEKNEMVFIPVDSRTLRLNPVSNKIYTTKDVDGNERLVNRRLHKLVRLYRKLNIEPNKLTLEEVSKNDIKTYKSV
jgi:hypothetical protein